MKTIKEIAEKLNKDSVNYEIGKLQDIRKELNGLKSKSGSAIFRDATIFENYAFHYGGSCELQFNIAFEDIKGTKMLRYGFAFSLQPSQTLPDIALLYPKILKLNTIIANNPQRFKDYKMWAFQGKKLNRKRTETKNVEEISENLVQNGTFIFIGKLIDINSITTNEILKTFDDLLPIYIEVESGKSTALRNDKKKQKGFTFLSKKTNFSKGTQYTSIQKQINVDARHSELQEALVKSLSKKYGKENVGSEIIINGQRIDVVLKQKNAYSFYEIKTANSAKQCVREALGQIFEYAYFDCQKYAEKIIVAGEHNLDNDTKKYLDFLNKEFEIPIEYVPIKIN